MNRPFWLLLAGVLLSGCTFQGDRADRGTYCTLVSEANLTDHDVSYQVTYSAAPGANRSGPGPAHSEPDRRTLRGPGEANVLHSNIDARNWAVTRILYHIDYEGKAYEYALNASWPGQAIPQLAVNLTLVGVGFFLADPPGLACS
jgi:hypothetical protein